jgi:hypothetical protein
MNQLDMNELKELLKKDGEFRKELAELVVAEIENDSSLKDKIVEMVDEEIAEKVRRRTY